MKLAIYKGIKPQIAIGLLAIHDSNKDTVFPTGVQTHVTIVYTVVEGHKIVGGYITSEKGNGHIKLTDFQPLPQSPGDSTSTSLSSSGKSSISGLKTLTLGNDKEAPLLNENSALEIEFREQMLIDLSQVVYNALRMKSNLLNKI